MVAYPGAKHISNRPEGGSKDFSGIIELAKKCAPPTEIETGNIVGGFATTRFWLSPTRLLMQ